MTSALSSIPGKTTVSPDRCQKSTREQQGERGKEEIGRGGEGERGERERERDRKRESERKRVQPAHSLERFKAIKCFRHATELIMGEIETPTAQQRRRS
jgi:hypothetical protein